MKSSKNKKGIEYSSHQLVFHFEGSTFILLTFFCFSEDVEGVFEFVWNVLLHGFGYRLSCVGEGTGQGSDFTEKSLDAFLRIQRGVDDLGQLLDLGDAHRWKRGGIGRKVLVVLRLTMVAILVALILSVIVGMLIVIAIPLYIVVRSLIIPSSFCASKGLIVLLAKFFK